MYLSYYGLERPPFDPAPQPDQLFETPTHNEALAGVVYGILEAKGFIALVGEVGVGKTTVLRRALQYVRAADPDLLIVEVTNPTLTPSALAARIQRALKTDGTVGAGDPEQLDLALRDLAAAKRRLVLIVDEAQDVSPTTFELLRILSNFDRGGVPLVQTVLTGQPELDEILGRSSQRALRQRIAVRAHIRPLSRREVAAYLRFRLLSAGVAPREAMSRLALHRIAAASGGFPRRANIISDNALIAGFGAGHRPIGWRTVGRALRALDAGLAPRRFRHTRLAWGTAGAAVVLAVLGWVGLTATAPVSPVTAHTVVQSAAPAVSTTTP